MTTNAMTKKDEAPKSVITNELAALYDQHAGAGHDDLTQGDYALPFLRVLQGLSPEIQRGNEKFIPGAQQGDLVHSITGEVFSGEKGVRLVRVAAEKKYIEWRPRKAGGGLVKIHDTPEDAARNRIPAINNPDTDTEIIETGQIFCLIETGAGWQPIVLSLTKTKLKTGWRDWNAVTAEQTYQKWGVPSTRGKSPSDALPIFGFIYRLTTASRTNPKGTFFVPVVDRSDIQPASPALVKRAAEFRELIRRGKVAVKVERDDAPVDDVPGDDVKGF